MAVSGKLSVKKRSEHGSRQCRHLRSQGLLPGNIYGHKQDPIPLTMSASELLALVKAGTRVLDLDVEGHVEKVLFREVQWDSFGNHIVHVDLLRVDPNEKLTIDVKVELKGTAPGTLGGGVLDHTLRHLTVECLAIQIPESIPVKIGALEIGQAIHVRDLEVPPNTKIMNNPDAVVVRVAQPGAELEATGALGEEGAAQPEVIGRKVAEGEEEGEADKEKKK